MCKPVGPSASPLAVAVASDPSLPATSADLSEVLQSRFALRCSYNIAAQEYRMANTCQMMLQIASQMYLKVVLKNCNCSNSVWRQRLYISARAWYRCTILLADCWALCSDIYDIYSWVWSQLTQHQPQPSSELQLLHFAGLTLAARDLTVTDSCHDKAVNSLCIANKLCPGMLAAISCACIYWPL